MKKSTMSIGGATFDLFVRANHRIVKDCEGRECFSLPLGSKVRVEEVIEACGGGASNTSVGLARLGCNAGFSGVVGDDQWGQNLLQNLQREGVDTQCTVVVERETSSFSLILSAESGERVILYDPGTNAHLHDVTFDRDTARKMDWVYLNHIQPDTCVIQNDLIEIFANTNIGLTWNPGGCQIDAGIEAKENRELLTHTNILLLNKEEALRFAKAKSIEEALRTLSNAGAQYVCITDGGNGCTATDGKMTYFCPTEKGNIVDTTGAGDAFGTGLTWAILQGEDLPKALITGTINATSVVSAIGAQTGLLTQTEITTKLAASAISVEKSSF